MSPVRTPANRDSVAPHQDGGTPPAADDPSDLPHRAPATPSRRDEGRRAALLDAADRVVQRDGPSATVSEIVAEAGVTKPVLYRHFGDKSGLYRALAERHTERLLTDLRRALLTRGDLRDRTVATIDTYLRAIEAQPQVYRLLTASTESQDVAVAGAVQTFVQRMAEELAAGIVIELRLPADRLPVARAWAYGIAGLVRGAGDWWLQDRVLTRTELTESLTALLLGRLGG